MSADLESILSGQGASMPEPAPAEVIQDTPAEPAAAAPQEQEHEPAEEHGMVPAAALKAEREKRKRYTEALEEITRKFEKSEQDRTASQQAIEQRLAQMASAFRPQAPAQPPAPPPDIYEAPDRFVQHVVAPVINPINERMNLYAREIAEIRHSPEAVKEAEAEFNRLASAGQLDPAIYQKIQSSHNPYAEAVAWYKQTKTLAEIGPDPDAYKAKLRDALKAEILAELQSQQPSPAASAAPAVLPSNFATGRNAGSRSGPAWSGPAPISDILGSRKK